MSLPLAPLVSHPHFHAPGIPPTLSCPWYPIHTFVPLVSHPHFHAPGIPPTLSCPWYPSGIPFGYLKRVICPPAVHPCPWYPTHTFMPLVSHPHFHAPGIPPQLRAPGIPGSVDLVFYRVSPSRAPGIPWILFYLFIYFFCFPLRHPWYSSGAPGRSVGPAPAADKSLDQGLTFNRSQRGSCSATYETLTQNQVVCK